MPPEKGYDYLNFLIISIGLLSLSRSIRTPKPVKSALGVVLLGRLLTARMGTPTLAEVPQIFKLGNRGPKQRGDHS